MKYLFIIDPQNDFIENGNLPVSGGIRALEKIIESKILKENWDKIFVTLDSHTPCNLGFGEPTSDLLKKIYKDVKVTQWPPHCIKGTHGWEIYEPLMKELDKLDNVEYILKGEEDDLEAYSAFNYSNGYRIKYNIHHLEEINSLEDVEIYYTGLAEDYCVLETIRSLMTYKVHSSGEIYRKQNSWKHILLQDMTAPINSREVVDELYSKLPKTLIRK